MEHKSERKSFLAFLLKDTVKKSLIEGNLEEVIEDTLHFLKRITEANYIAITLWDRENDIPYYHKFISDDVDIPIAKPGRAPIGVCMLRKVPVYGKFEDFPLSDPKLSEVIGEVMCLPVIIPGNRLLGAVGIGRRKGAPPFTFWADANLQIASNLFSAILSVKVLQDMLSKQKQLSSSLLRILNSVSSVRTAGECYRVILSTAMEVFNADFGFLGKVNYAEHRVDPVYTLGLDLEQPPPIRFGVGLVGKTAVQRKPRLFKGFPTGKAPEGYEKQAEKVGSAVSAPIMVDGRMKFIIVLARKKNKERFGINDLYFIHIFQKVFNLIMSLQERKEEREKFEIIKSRADKLNSMATLAGGVAHDFNNIINVIMGYAQLGYEKEEDPQVKGFFEAIYRQCRHASSLTSQILALSREQPERKELVDLRPLVKGFKKLMERTLPENIAIKYEDDGALEYPVVGDPSQIHTMLLNLASNAKDAMPNGGTLTLRLQKRHAPDNMKGDHAVVLEVEDTGNGIPPEITERIFDPFFTTKEPGKGTGLGLSQVYHAVSGMGGFIDVKNLPTRGTRFSIYLPEAGKTQREKKSAPETCRALVVEEQKELLSAMVEMLSRAGVEAVPAAGYQEALSLFSPEIDLLIADEELSHTPGSRLAGELMRRKEGLHVLLIAPDRKSGERLKERLGERGDVLIKPFTFEELMEKLKGLSGR